MGRVGLIWTACRRRVRSSSDTIALWEDGATYSNYRPRSAEAYSMSTSGHFGTFVLSAALTAGFIAFRVQKVSLQRETDELRTDLTSS